MPGTRKSPEERYRLYIDESGDHVFRQVGVPHHRFLCLLGCWLKGSDYRKFHAEIEVFKQEHIPHSPDEPVILHREDIVNRRGAFWRLREAVARRRFDEGLISLLENTPFRVVGVVIDKQTLRQRYPAPAHPYHLALGFLLQRYCGYLNYINREGDVMAESRGGREDRLLKASYEFLYGRGVWRVTNAAFFQGALTTRTLKLKPKSANIAGLQLADVLAHPVRKAILVEKRIPNEVLSPFAERLWRAVRPKLNRHEHDGREWGYGMVFFPD